MKGQLYSRSSRPGPEGDGLDINVQPDEGNFIPQCIILWLEVQTLACYDLPTYLHTINWPVRLHPLYTVHIALSLGQLPTSSNTGHFTARDIFRMAAFYIMEVPE